jgi:hypothetical protein
VNGVQERGMNPGLGIREFVIILETELFCWWCRYQCHYPLSIFDKVFGPYEPDLFPECLAKYLEAKREAMHAAA